MAFLGFKVPADTAQLFKSIDVPGHRESFSHITVLNFGKEMDAKTLSRAMETAFDVASTMKPFTVRTDTVTCFPAGDDGVPIICPVQSDAIQGLWKRLGEAFDAAEIPFSKKFPVYRPHVTLAYADSPIVDRKIPLIEWGAHELILWGGDGGDRGVVVHMPFSLRAASGLRTYDLRKNLLASRVVERFRGYCCSLGPARR